MVYTLHSKLYAPLLAWCHHGQIIRDLTSQNTYSIDIKRKNRTWPCSSLALVVCCAWIWTSRSPITRISCPFKLYPWMSHAEWMRDNNFSHHIMENRKSCLSWVCMTIYVILHYYCINDDVILCIMCCVFIFYLHLYSLCTSKMQRRMLSSYKGNAIIFSV